MTLGLCFWILMLLWLVLGAVRGGWTVSTPEGRYFVGGHLLTFFLFLLLGWHAFGSPIKP